VDPTLLEGLQLVEYEAPTPCTVAEQGKSQAMKSLAMTSQQLEPMGNGLAVDAQGPRHVPLGRLRHEASQYVQRG
jgi:hypothetical protein